MTRGTIMVKGGQDDTKVYVPIPGIDTIFWDQANSA